ncbi:MAG: hypothetical protein A2848_01005 [Candidatus Magasanikbacteria bacterium RIFCSPHIGHO2_01_FULL_50_8]|uniref:Carbohydrate kinase PfkB domain-containing protein n=2 Tax=Candidatus Magasanikiibacteriota TaxID=1752731 RepID=A0A1F6LS23_9BACT|nr:MAG: hypothetical protein A2848_01005 [Candidatus Magasanikbacteria bacterium RIFCSPHIGHO2_01_FULL_50_8]OGH67524.1 MAG: hypothetical protein A3C15_03745 [Candidatus Magasanikbacteria bacterium RIFCSPHIGHO2_02_FULL_50_9b]
MNLDLLTVGDATIDTFLFIHDAQVNCSLQKDACQLCMNYADKLPVEKISRTVAGNAANNAIGSTRLGLNTAFVTTLGNDGSGEWILKKLTEEKVDTTFVRLDKKLETNSSVVLSFKGERTILVYHAPRKYQLPTRLPSAKFVYYTSVGEHHHRLNAELIAYVKKTGARLAFNPGTYQLRSGMNALKPVFAVTDCLFLNKEEAVRIVGTKENMRAYLTSFRAFGPKTVVITDGPTGSFVLSAGKFYQMGIPKTPVVERTGAGDAFASGFIAALARGKKVPEAMCWGTMNSSSVIMYIGPQQGLLTLTGMQKFHKKITHRCAQEM